jgi:hypothetical protein
MTAIFICFIGMTVVAGINTYRMRYWRSRATELQKENEDYARQIMFSLRHRD